MARLCRLTVVVIVLTFAPMQAWAGCAWVLWIDSSWRGSNRDGGSYWTIITSTSTEAACRAEAEWKIKQLSERGKSDPADLEVTVNGNIISKRFGTGANWRVISSDRVLCLPDTIDPRGPKGGER
jgi:hypothetical protein